MPRVLDKGHVELEWFAGGDLDVINAAKVSFNKKIKEVDESGEKLIQFLMKNRHGTPFEHCTFKFNIKAPISVAREWFRHRVSSYNEVSGRYTKLDFECYVPAPEHVRTQVGKPGHYKFESMPYDDAIEFVNNLKEVYDICYKFYEHSLEKGIAKELARQVLPVGLYTQWIWTVNPRALMNFLSLRNDKHAMFEIREYAQSIEEIFAESMPITHAAFEANGRVAP